jgi:hypothetical protein
MRRNTKAAGPGEFTPSELRALHALKSPAGIQRFLDDIPYHLAGNADWPARFRGEETALSGGRSLTKKR